MTLPQRKRTRMEGFDYSTPGCYFVTITTNAPGAWFGEIVGGVIIANDAGNMVGHEWLSIPDHYPGVTVDDWVVMPDHLHGIVMLGTDPMVSHIPTLSEVIGTFKSRTTLAYGRGVREAGWQPFNNHLWHRSFRDTIIRTDRSLAEFCAYIEGNPGRWSEKHGR